MSEKEKADIGAKATEINIPVGELLRRAYASFDPDQQSAELEALAIEFERVVKQTEPKLDHAIAMLASMSAQIHQGGNA